MIWEEIYIVVSPRPFWDLDGQKKKVGKMDERHTGNGKRLNKCPIVSPQNLLCHEKKSYCVLDTIGMFSNDGAL